MKFAFTVLFSFFLVASSFAQDEYEGVIDSLYPYRVVESKKIQGLPYGIFLYTTAIDLSPNPPFFNRDEMGLVIHEQYHSIGVGRNIVSVIETTNHIVITTEPYSSNILFPAVNDVQMFIALKKSSKKVVVRETGDESVSLSDIEIDWRQLFGSFKRKR